MKKLLAVLVIASLLTLSACVSKQITMEEAKEIALNDAGVDAASATFTTEKQEDRDYEFEFTANGTLYSYEITAGGKNLTVSYVELGGLSMVVVYFQYH